LFVVGSPVQFPERKRIADLAVKHRLPTVVTGREYAEVGGLLSYAVNYPALFRRAAWYVDRIIKGARPADLPVEQPTTFELISQVPQPLGQSSATTSRSVRCQYLSVAMLGEKHRRWGAMSKKGGGGERKNDAAWSRRFGRVPRCDRWRARMTSVSPPCNGGFDGRGNVPWTASIGATVLLSRRDVVELNRR